MAYGSIETQLKKIIKDRGVSNLKTSSGETVGDILKSEAQKLLDILEEEIEKLYSTRPEGWYERSNDLRNSLDKSLVIDPKTNTITIGFISQLAWHNSWITKTNPDYSKQAYTPQAVREGYEVFNTGHHIDGIDFIQDAIDRFNSIKRDGITVEIEDSSVRENWVK